MTHLFFYFLLLQLLPVMIIDAMKRKISNWWSIVNIIIFLGLFLLGPVEYRFQVRALIYPSIFLVVGFILFVLKVMGGGDAKYLFSFFLIIPLTFQGMAVEKLLYTTILIGLVLIVLNTIRERKKIVTCIMIRDWKGLFFCYGKRFPYAPVLFLSWVWLGWTKNFY